MKFKHLKSEFELLVNGDQEAVDPAALESLKEGLEEKKAKYTRKLKKGISMAKRDSVEAKLEELQGILKALKSAIANQAGR